MYVIKYACTEVLCQSSVQLINLIDITRDQERDIKKTKERQKRRETRESVEFPGNS